MSAESMIHELRLYQVAPGRMADVHARFQHHLPDIFRRHGLWNVGRWTAVAGSDAPLFVYMMAYADLAQRERGWAGLYEDEEWLRVRATTNAGSEMVERYALMFLRACSAWQPDSRMSRQPVGGVHELLLQQVVIGQRAATETYLRETYLPVVEEAGGQVMMVSEVLSGVELPRYALMFAWRDALARHQGRLAVESDVRILEALRQQRVQMGGTLLGRATVFVLEPPAAALPLAALGR